MNDLKNNFFEIYSPEIKEFSKYSYILIPDSNIKNLNKVYSLIDINKYNIPILTKTEWCAAKLEKIPSEYLLKDEIEVSAILRSTKNRSFQLKRTFDIFISIFLLLSTFPIVILTIFLIFIEDGFPIFYIQKRHGIDNKIIKLPKFRSMLKTAEINGPTWAKKDDIRVTKIGKYIRLLRIDEIPQLLLVLKGEMSLVGPRPERPEIDEFLKEKIHLYDLRYKVLPGISGWAQVNYPYGSSTYDSKEKLSYDLFYIKNQSFLLDLLIILKTVRRVLTASGANPNTK
ncbi:sugar transferase [Prochlorococcus marinus]|uniref:sugar transferase n=1 Tax=Prochlorococcus marinus TaxID=1219 RepID=UPI001C5716A9|nr:sugar transferase [Prochlorococcus marinus]